MIEWKKGAPPKDREILIWTGSAQVAKWSDKLGVWDSETEYNSLGDIQFWSEINAPGDPQPEPDWADNRIDITAAMCGLDRDTALDCIIATGMAEMIHIHERIIAIHVMEKAQRERMEAKKETGK